jgi:hypothetical protein
MAERGSPGRGILFASGPFVAKVDTEKHHAPTELLLTRIFVVNYVIKNGYGYYLFSQ